MLFVQTNNKPSYSQNKHAQWSLFPQLFSRQMCAKLSCANEAYACGLVVERDSTCNLCTCIILYFNIFNLDLTAVCKLPLERYSAPAMSLFLPRYIAVCHLSPYNLHLLTIKLVLQTWEVHHSWFFKLGSFTQRELILHG